MPSLTTAQKWLWPQNDPLGERRKQYAQAREDQADVYADEIIDIANTATDRDTAAAAKVRIDARIWHAGKVRPKKWGDKPGDIHVHNNQLIISQDKANELQERKRKALDGIEIPSSHETPAPREISAS